MARLAFVALVVAAAFGGWYFFTHYQVGGVESLTVEPRTTSPGSASSPTNLSGAAEQPQEQLPVPQGRKTIQIATINLGPFDRKKLDKPHVVDRLVQLLVDHPRVALAEELRQVAATLALHRLLELVPDQRSRWTEWVIDLQAFADQGVDLTNVDTIAIGFGDKNPGAPGQAGGTGLVFFDDIRLYRPVL